MAEAPPGAPLKIAPPGRDVLLATKLHIPRPQPGFVPRPRLASALDEGLARGLALVCAPAGAGKTALLADWAQHSRRPVAWLSLDPGDNDPARFWRHVVAALDRARPGTADRVAPLLGPPAPPSFEGTVTTIVNELTTKPDEAVLMLDDYHLIDARPVHASLAFLLEHLPPGLHLVLASRSDPPLPLARLRAGRQLAELRAGDLRFTGDEAAALLREATGADLPGAAVAALASRTEGWAAGLQLAGLSLRGQADTAGFVAAFSGSHRYVLDYLTEEVLERQPESVRGFLLETSVLDQLSGPLCDAVTGRPDSQAMLEQVEQAACSWYPWTRCAAGGATITCSPTCSVPACRPNDPAGSRRCTAMRPPGTRRMGSLTAPCATPWAPGTPPGRRGWSSSTPTSSSTCGAKGQRSSGGLRRFQPRWSARGPGCC